MSSFSPLLQEELSRARLEETQAGLRKIERRDWWLWVVADIVILLLTLTVLSLTFSGLIKTDDWFFQFNLNQAVRGLVGLILLFNTYTIYQQVMIKRLRTQLSEQLSTMGMLQARAEEFHKLAITDSLTGLYNRRFGEQRLVAEAARSRRYGHPLTVVALDLDNFKRINDRYGHLAGDAALKAFANRMLQAIRVSDLAVRMGGDEFLALLPECPPDRVEPLLIRLGNLEVNHRGHKIPITFSAGWVSYARDETPEQFLDRADRTLYANKRASKIELAEAPAMR